MKKINLLLLLISFAYQNSFSQPKTSIEGKWKPMSVSDSEMHYNIKKDSLWLSPEISQNLDSPINLATMTQLYRELFKLADSSFLIFGKKGTYQEIEDGKIVATGTFTIDKKREKLKLDITRNNIPLKIQHSFQLKGNELLLMDDEKGDVTFIYEKVFK